jgi:hypothetical protein
MTGMDKPFDDAAVFVFRNRDKIELDQTGLESIRGNF